MHALVWALYAALNARRDRADLYYTRDVAVAYWLVRLNLPTVYEAHTVPNRAQCILLRQLISKPALKAVVVITTFIKERIVRELGFLADKVFVHPSSTDLSLFADLPSTNDCRQRLGLPQGRPIVGYIGRFRTMEMEKGIPELIQAIAQLHSLGENAPLLLCVGGPTEAVPRYFDLARKCGVRESSLKFVDHVPNRDVPFLGASL